MEYKTLKNTTLPKIGIGSWDGLWGRAKKPNLDKNRDIKLTEVIKTAVNLGITHIDTAESYGNGYSEEIIGEAIKDFDRKTLFITTKVSGSHLDYESINSSAECSLRRLGTDYIDLYLVHWFNNEIPLAETMNAMNDLIDRGLIKSIGVSNFSLSQIIEAQRCSKNKFLAMQVEYNLDRRDNGRYTKNIESEIIPYCQKNDIFIIAYKPLAAGKFEKSTYNLLNALTKKYEKTPAQITLNWLLSKKNSITIPGTTNLQHMKENLGALGWEMTKEDIELLNNISIQHT